jgi:hypothetical protein
MLQIDISFYQHPYGSTDFIVSYVPHARVIGPTKLHFALPGAAKSTADSLPLRLDGRNTNICAMLTCQVTGEIALKANVTNGTL